MTKAALLVSGLLLALTACAAQQATAPATGPPTTGPASAPPQSDVVVDTPALRAQKSKAGIEQCRPGTPTDEAPDPEEALPDVTLACLGGGPAVYLRDLRGPMVINLWAQWCGPCRAELPYYQQLHERAGAKVQVIGIDWLDTQPESALALAAESGVTYPLLADPTGVLRTQLRIRGLPGVVFVDATGRVSAVEFTVVRSYGELAALVETHLGVAL